MSNKEIHINEEDIVHLNSHEQYEILNNLIDHNHLADKKIKVSSSSKKAFSKASEKLDKYYTKPEIAKLCYENLLALLNKNTLSDTLFVEPSAGSGTFLDAIKEDKIGFDLAPTRNSNHEIIKTNFLTDDITSHINSKKKNHTVFIGNPPFGTKSKLAIEFVNKCLSYSNVVGFILPLQFRKWSVQGKINQNAKLILDLELPENSFAFMGKDYNVRCSFQVWALPSFETTLPDLRIKTKPLTSHEDFEMYQYNRTQMAEKYFDYDWDFAVFRQGYLDYSFKAFKKEDCNRKQQWIFFKAKNKEVLNNLLTIDFDKLSKKNIGIPGFGKADVIFEYEEKFGSK